MNSDSVRFPFLIVAAAACFVVVNNGVSAAQSDARPSVAEPQPALPPAVPAAEPFELPVPVLDPITQDKGDPMRASDPGYQPLLQGPVHEAFAAPSKSDPSDGRRLTTKPPPDPVDERPPTAAREHEGMKWIPGYWAFSDEANDYLWVSGMWRQCPPGRTWISGYWTETPEGYRWTTGYWGRDPTLSDTPDYLPQPPASIDNGPSVPPPEEDYFWVPGHWEYAGSGYQWQGGFWSAQPSDWIWQPTCYVSTPNGYLLVDGYWDYLPETRGQLYAPVHFYDPVYLRPNYVYRPRYPLVRAAALLLQLFARPGYSNYFYGNFYGPSYAALGYRPWYDSGFGFGYGTPWLAFYDWRYRKSDINFGRSMRRHGNSVSAKPRQSSAKYVGGKPALTAGTANAFPAVAKHSKTGRTIDAVVRSDSARVPISRNKALMGDFGRSVTGSESARSGPPGRSRLAGTDRFSATNKSVASSPSKGVRASPLSANSRRGVGPASGGSGQFAHPSNSRSKGSYPSFGRQDSPPDRGRKTSSFSGRSKSAGNSKSFSGGSKSAGKSKTSRGGSKGRGKGKK